MNRRTWGFECARIAFLLLVSLFFLPAIRADEIGPGTTLNSGDDAWMLTSSALVLMMTGPGLALFYGGLVRRKNVLGTMMQSFIMMAAVSIIWAIIGYSLAFDYGNPFIGGLHFAF